MKAAQNQNICVPLKMLPHGRDLPMPGYGSEQASGFNIYAAIPENQSVTLFPNERKLIPTGICIDLPRGLRAEIKPLFSHALKHGVTVLNSPMVIDPGNRDELKLILINHGHEDFHISRADHIANVMVTPAYHAKLDIRMEFLHAETDKVE